MLEGLRKPQGKDIKRAGALAAGAGIGYGIAKAVERYRKNHPHVKAFHELSHQVERSDQLPFVGATLELPYEEMSTRGIELYGFGDSRMRVDETTLPDARSKEVLMVKGREITFLPKKIERFAKKFLRVNGERFTDTGGVVDLLAQQLSALGIDANAVFKAHEGDPSSTILEKLLQEKENIINSDKNVIIMVMMSGNDFRQLFDNLPELGLNIHIPHLANPQKLKGRVETITQKMSENAYQFYTTLKEIHEARLANGKGGLLGSVVYVPAKFEHENNFISLTGLDENGQDEDQGKMFVTSQFKWAGNIGMGSSVNAIDFALQKFQKENPDFKMTAVHGKDLNGKDFDGSYHLSEEGHQKYSEETIKHLAIVFPDGRKVLVADLLDQMPERKQLAA